MFYDKEIKILEEEEGYVNDSGRWVDGELVVVKTIECDVQPYNKSLAYRDYAFDKDVKYRIFCNPEPLIELGLQVSYQEPFKNKETIFNVVNIINWDDYWVVLLDD